MISGHQSEGREVPKYFKGTQFNVTRDLHDVIEDGGTMKEHKRVSCPR